MTDLTPSIALDALKNKQKNEIWMLLNRRTENAYVFECEIND